MMLAPKSWLTEFVDLKGISDEQFAREMTFAGNKVESIQTLRVGGQKKNGEIVYEFEITSNRPDTLSMIGIAREAAAVFDRKLKLPVCPKEKNLKQLPIKLTVENKTICPVFSVVELDNIKVKPTSSIIRKRLEASGIRPINNVVDVTNYLMLETGQPMHAFDADTLNGPLTLRAAKPGEHITPLDHKERVLNGGEIIIENREKLVDLAGLMGGLNSEISQETKRVLLLVPIYDPIAIRRASKFLRLRTEASTRFEKELDLTQTETAALHAIELLEKEADAKQTTAIVTMRSFVNFQQPIIISAKKLSSLAGRIFTEKEIETYVAKVGIKKTPKGFQPSSWRRDITIPVDLVEEVTRLYGYNKFQRTLPSGKIPINADALMPNWKRIVAEQCTALGYTETYASTLIGKTLIDELGFYTSEQHLKVLHPMSEDFEYMRRTTLETLIPFLKQNLNETAGSLRNFQGVNIFELGTVFIPSAKKSDLPEQPLELGLISTASFAECKGHIEHLGKTLGVSLEFSLSNKSLGSMINMVTISLGKVSVGQIGQISFTYAGYLNMTAIFNVATTAFQYPKLSGYPPIVEDLTLERPLGNYLSDVMFIIKNVSPLVHAVDYLGEYQHFVTLRVTYQSFDRSLTQEEVSRIRKTLLKKLESMGWKLKS